MKINQYRLIIWITHKVLMFSEEVYIALARERFKMFTRVFKVMSIFAG